MQLTDLGPLERSVLKAVLHAELVGAAVPAEFIWRTLPGYETHLSNVEAALADGLPLRGWLTHKGGLFSCRDRAELPRGVSAARRRGEARWQEVRALVVGLGKLPWVEAVAVVGPMAWGLLPSICDPCPVAIIAEGGRTDLARAAVSARLSAAGEAGEAVELAHTFDGDDLVHAELEPAAGLVLATLRPVTNLDAWTALRQANPWLAGQYPNARLDAPELPDLLAGDRVDGKLAALRRRLVGRRDAGAVLGEDGRRRGPLRWIEAGLDRALKPRREIGVEALLGADFGRRFEQRWSELSEWVMQDEPGSEPEPADARSAGDHEVEVEVEVEHDHEHEHDNEHEVEVEDEHEVEGSPEGSAVARPSPRSRRSRGPTRRPASQHRSPAASQTGQRLTGAGRKRRA